MEPMIPVWKSSQSYIMMFSAYCEPSSHDNSHGNSHKSHIKNTL